MPEPLTPYIPLDILHDREDAKRQRLAEVMRYLEREAERDEDVAHEHACLQQDAHHAVQATAHYDQDAGPSHSAAACVAVNHIDTQMEQGKCSLYTKDNEYTRTHMNAVLLAALPKAVPSVFPPVPVLPPPPISSTQNPDKDTRFVSGTEGNRRPLQQQRRRRLRIAVKQDRRELSVPNTVEEKTHLVTLFREEILHNFVNLREPVRVSAHDVRMREVQQALSNDAMLGQKPYLLMSNITRHDWHRSTGICEYTVNLKNGPKSGSAEHLAAYYAGVEHTLWEYWGSRKSIRPHHVRRYINAYNPQGFYQAMMYQHLPTREWIGRWQQLRDSGRV
ncbi:hypothetical protein QFC22_006405 [Naganishia vaughanmartiniae]|uniref:Uncharacterized protein n=1 Tax=Naganishia vaughanmartiniae TaxID=1424756 RepID=A0ACC2WK47_9TREE|nr:hypothetical protein QFC22_006405 [Naganishia vaughanmartiniae]